MHVVMDCTWWTWSSWPSAPEPSNAAWRTVAMAVVAEWMGVRRGDRSSSQESNALLRSHLIPLSTRLQPDRRGSGRRRPSGASRLYSSCSPAVRNREMCDDVWTYAWARSIHTLCPKKLPEPRQARICTAGVELQLTSRWMAIKYPSILPQYHCIHTI